MPLILPMKVVGKQEDVLNLECANTKQNAKI